MNLMDCYRLLELSPPSDLQEVKTSYRRLARAYHPDINPAPQAQEKFIQITEAYNLLLRVMELPPIRHSTPPPQPEPIPDPPPLSAFDLKLKQSCYQQLQELLRYKRFPRAMAIVEGLAERLPQDLEIKQWQALTYQTWGRHLIGEGQYDKAKQLLRKALSTDPHNQSLWSEVEQDFRRLEQIA